jgi:hypothetical protein
MSFGFAIANTPQTCARCGDSVVGSSTTLSIRA